ncbi:MFS transporter [Orrella marina]|uniref:MFS transporter n=1 Tax=Orrella marina TaxID=2163011 RepID=A0A2R4XLZ3_9BURK|nr:MFS transporter [Orrella marina]
MSVNEPDPDARGPVNRSLMIALTGLMGLALAMGVGRFAYTPLLPMMQTDQGMSLQTGSWVALVNMLGYLVGGLTGKYLTGAPVRNLRLAAAGIILSLAGMAMTDHGLLWGTWRLVAGIASAWMMIMVSMITLPRLAGSPRLPGIVYAGVGAGTLLAGLLCAVFVGLGWTSHAAWLSLAGVSLLLAIPLWTVFERSWDQTAVVASRSQGDLPGAGVDPAVQARLWRLVVCYGLYGFGYILPATYLPAQARLLLQDSWTYSLAWPVFGLAAACSTLVVGLVASRLGLLRSWAGAQVVLTAGVATPIVWPSMTGILVASLCVGGTFVVITLVAMQEAQRSGGARSGLWMARLTASFAFGQVLGPAVIVLLQGRLEIGLGLAATALLVSLTGLVWQLQQDGRKAVGI